MWGTVIGFLGKFSVKTYLYIGLATLALTFGLKVYNGIQAHFAKVENLRQANVELTIQKAAFEIEKKSNEIVIEAFQLAMATQAEALNIVNSEFSQARVEAEKQKRVLDSSRLRRLAAEHADRMESLSNEATKARFTEIEGVINEDF